MKARLARLATNAGFTLCPSSGQVVEDHVNGNWVPNWEMRHNTGLASETLYFRSLREVDDYLAERADRAAAIID